MALEAALRRFLQIAGPPRSSASTTCSWAFGPSELELAAQRNCVNRFLRIAIGNMQPEPDHGDGGKLNRCRPCYRKIQVRHGDLLKCPRTFASVRRKSPRFLAKLLSPRKALSSATG